MKLKKSSDSIRALVLDYLILLDLDKNGHLRDDFSLEGLGPAVSALDAALAREKDRDVQILLHLLRNRVETKSPEQ